MFVETEHVNPVKLRTIAQLTVVAEQRVPAVNIGAGVRTHAFPILLHARAVVPAQAPVMEPVMTRRHVRALVDNGAERIVPVHVQPAAVHNHGIVIRNPRARQTVATGVEPIVRPVHAQCAVQANPGTVTPSPRARAQAGIGAKVRLLARVISVKVRLVKIIRAVQAIPVIVIRKALAQVPT